jgi:hypothetical protein
MNAHTTPSRDRRSHPPIAQIWQFGIPRADSLRIRRRAPNRPLCVVCDTWIPRGNASDGVVMTPAGVPGWHGALRPVRAHPGWIRNSVVAPRLVPGGWLPGWLPNSGHNIENRFVRPAPRAGFEPAAYCLGGTPAQAPCRPASTHVSHERNRQKQSFSERSSNMTSKAGSGTGVRPVLASSSACRRMSLSWAQRRFARSRCR